LRAGSGTTTIAGDTQPSATTPGISRTNLLGSLHLGRDYHPALRDSTARVARGQLADRAEAVGLLIGSSARATDSGCATFGLDGRLDARGGKPDKVRLDQACA
jgi:hypothetical protein